MVYGERIRWLRKQNGDTQEELAKKLRIAVYTLRNYERERSQPDLMMIVSICRLYHVSSDFLLGLTDQKPIIFTRYEN